MSELTPKPEGETILVKYRDSHGGDIMTVSGEVTASHPNGTGGWIMKLSPTRDLSTVRLDGDARGAFVETKMDADTWRRIGVAEAIHVPDTTTHE